ncbi:hypothetical protein F4778DRAFT_782682 [Xylariomycetidae sp. FL2044]|nr:hypothetical protein F4778DRAFT_782682 [Xylariomycetidae sp. FL2044]
MLLDIADNAFARSPETIDDEESGAVSMYYQHIFREFAEKWVDPRYDAGPFVMVHGDFQPFNLLVDEEQKIVGVLDWEWSRVVPLQYFIPPLWLKYASPSDWAHRNAYDDFYLKRSDELHAIVQKLERQKYGNQMLADEWSLAKPDCGFVVAYSLENWSNIDWFAHAYLNISCLRLKKDLEPRAAEFVAADPSRGIFLREKVR